nr:hypothetical protein B0A51_11792 [Rachicladosporium sp. CCFEE 5018]
MADLDPKKAVTLEYRGKIAIITISNEKKLNAMTQDLYFRLSQLIREVALRDDIFVTVLTAKGRYFSAGADVSISRAAQPGVDPYKQWLTSFLANNLNTTQAFYSHPKILVTALNGPAVGLSAAIISHSDFIYAAPHAFILTPFSSLGLVTEGLVSHSFVKRMGIAKANEALIMSKRITSDELVQCGFVNKVFDTKPSESDKFLELVLNEVNERLGDHLVQDSMTKIKALIRKPDKEALDAQGVAEVFGGLERFMAGIPQKEFERIASGQKKHKLKVRCDLERPACSKRVDQSESTAQRAGIQYLRTHTFQETDSTIGDSVILFKDRTSPPTSPATSARTLSPRTLSSPAANRAQFYETFIDLYNPKNVSSRSQGFDYMRMVVLLAPSSPVLTDSLDALSLVQGGSLREDQRLLQESTVQLGKALRGARRAIVSSKMNDDGILAAVSVLALCEFYNHIQGAASSWFQHLAGFDQILLARGPRAVSTKLSMLMLYNSRHAGLSRSLIRRKADPFATPEWQAVLRKVPLGPAVYWMSLALQTPGLLERHDNLDLQSADSAETASELLANCERLDEEMRRWYEGLLMGLRMQNLSPYMEMPIEEFDAFCSVVQDRTLQTGFVFLDQKFAFLHSQYWCCIYYLRSTLASLRQRLRSAHDTPVDEALRPDAADDGLLDLVFNLCKCLPAFAEPVTGAHGHIAMFLPLGVAETYCQAESMIEWVNFVADVSANVFNRGLNRPSTRQSDRAITPVESPRDIETYEYTG